MRIFVNYFCIWSTRVNCELKCNSSHKQLKIIVNVSTQIDLPTVLKSSVEVSSLSRLHDSFCIIGVIKIRPQYFKCLYHSSTNEKIFVSTKFMSDSTSLDSMHLCCLPPKRNSSKVLQKLPSKCEEQTYPTIVGFTLS